MFAHSVHKHSQFSLHLKVYIAWYKYFFSDNFLERRGKFDTESVQTGLSNKPDDSRRISLKLLISVGPVISRIYWFIYGVFYDAVSNSD
jgi:hypothetical protein